MDEGAPFPPNEPEDVSDELQKAQKGLPTARLEGEIVDEPEVPPHGDFEVKKVVRLDPDLETQKRRAREMDDRPSGQLSLRDTVPYGSPVNKGHKGRGARRKNDDKV